MTRTHLPLAVGLVAMFAAVCAVLSGTTFMEAQAGDEKPTVKECKQTLKPLNAPPASNVPLKPLEGPKAKLTPINVERLTVGAGDVLATLEPEGVIKVILPDGAKAGDPVKAGQILKRLP